MKQRLGICVVGLVETMSLVIAGGSVSNQLGIEMMPLILRGIAWKAIRLFYPPGGQSIVSDEH